ncbi:MAG: protein-glutamate methylesterase/protein-glutamine glutaminase [bacterium]
MRKIKVLIVDDSSLVRVFLTKALSDAGNIEVVGTAANPYQAVEEIKKKRPDLLTLDVEMPGMNGLEFLEKLMKAHPMPVIMVSTLTAKGSRVTIKALELGAVDFIEKPIIKETEDLDGFKREILGKIQAFREIEMKKVLNTVRKRDDFHNRETKIKADNKKIIAIGASTGGVQTLKKLLPSFTSNFPGVVIIQHMPADFTSAFAEMLNKISAIDVKEAEDGDIIKSGVALIAPGDYHLEVIEKKGNYIVSLNKGKKVNYQRPAVDISFNSLAKATGKNIIAVLLTGMGVDGARGMLNIRKAGGYAIAQDESTSIVYGMPKAAVKLNAVDEVLPLDQISQRIKKILNEV